MTESVWRRTAISLRPVRSRFGLPKTGLRRAGELDRHVASLPSANCCPTLHPSVTFVRSCSCYTIRRRSSYGTGLHPFPFLQYHRTKLHPSVTLIASCSCYITGLHYILPVLPSVVVPVIAPDLIRSRSCYITTINSTRPSPISLPVSVTLSVAVPLMAPDSIRSRSCYISPLNSTLPSLLCIPLPVMLSVAIPMRAPDSICSRSCMQPVTTAPERWLPMRGW